MHEVKGGLVRVVTAGIHLNCYCPNCGIPIYIPCNLCNTES